MATQAPAATQQRKQLPFTLGSAFTSRQAFQTATIPLTAGTQMPPGFPLQIKSFGWVTNITLNFTLTFTALANTAFGADGVDALIDSIGVRTSGGNPLIQPIGGYALHMDNLFGGKRFGASTLPYGTDPDQLPGTALGITASSANTITFTRSLQFEIDATSGLGSIPATASNREFTIDLSLASLSTLFPTGAPAAANLAINATSWYWDLPADESVPFGVDNSGQTLRLLSREQTAVNAGTNKVQSVNRGNVFGNHILIFRENGVRVDADYPLTSEITIDNNVRFWLQRSEWKAQMGAWFGLGLNGQAADTAGGLRSGVYVIPWRLLAGGSGNNPHNSHAQYLATMNTTQLEFTGYNYGNSGTLEILGDQVSTPNAAYIYSK